MHQALTGRLVICCCASRRALQTARQWSRHTARIPKAASLAYCVTLPTPHVKSDLGRGRQGRGRRSDKGPITVANGTSERQKKPSVTLIFNRLLLTFVLSRQLPGIFGNAQTVQGSVGKSREFDC